MAKISLKESNPRYYAQIQAEQDQIKRQYAGQRIARLCPYCDHKVEVLYRGSHGAASIKCPKCGEDVTFPPVAFRMAR